MYKPYIPCTVIDVATNRVSTIGISAISDLVLWPPLGSRHHLSQAPQAATVQLPLRHDPAASKNHNSSSHAIIEWGNLQSSLGDSR